MVKVVYTDGSTELFDTNKPFEHNSEHRLFKVVFEHNSVMIPDHSVRSIGIGHIDTIYAGKHGEFEVVKEVFVYE